MIPCPIDGSETRVLKNPITGADLHVIAARGLVFTAWRFTAEEMRQVNEGAPVWVVLHGEVLPVFNLTVGRRNEVVPPEVIRIARRNEAIISSPAAVEVNESKARQTLLIDLVAYAFGMLFMMACGLIGWGVWRLIRG